MNRDKFVALVFATLEPHTSHVVVEMSNGEIGLVKGVTSKNGEVVIQVTMDAREEMK